MPQEGLPDPPPEVVPKNADPLGRRTCLLLSVDTIGQIESAG
jgi:hypothetical protein